MQAERCPRISANDLVSLVNEKPDEVISIDLRSHLEYNRAHLKCSINIPFASISIADVRLDALNIPDLEVKLTNRNVVVLSTSHENAVLVGFESFLEYQLFYLSFVLIFCIHFSDFSSPISYLIVERNVFVLCTMVLIFYIALYPIFFLPTPYLSHKVNGFKFFYTNNFHRAFISNHLRSFVRKLDEHFQIKSPAQEIDARTKN